MTDLERVTMERDAARLESLARWGRVCDLTDKCHALEIALDEAERSARAWLHAMAPGSDPDALSIAGEMLATVVAKADRRGL